MAKMNVEVSREIRLWAKTGISALSTITLIDYMANDGKGTQKALNWLKNGTNKIKEKIGNFKEKLSHKTEEESE